jgi:hypothetical protein
MDLRHLTTDVLLFNLILYGCLPLWLIMGCLDYYCHRKSHIERTTGMKESLMHIIMGAQIGVPVFLGLFFNINVLLLLIMFLVLVFHEWVAHHDVKYALHNREISLLETHVHSFLEVLPFVIVALIICINWQAFVDLITLNWAGHMSLAPKDHPLDRMYIAGYVLLMLIADAVPFLEEFVRCWANRSAIAKQETSNVN